MAISPGATSASNFHRPLQPGLAFASSIVGIAGGIALPVYFIRLSSRLCLQGT